MPQRLMQKKGCRPSSPGGTSLHASVAFGVDSHLIESQAVLPLLHANSVRGSADEGEHGSTPQEPRRPFVPSSSSSHLRRIITLTLAIGGAALALLVTFGGGMAYQSRRFAELATYSDLGAGGNAETGGNAMPRDFPADSQEEGKGPAKTPNVAVHDSAAAAVSAEEVGVDRSNFFKNIHQRKCKMSYTHDHDRTEYKIRKGAYFKEWDPVQRRAHFTHRLNEATHNHRNDEIMVEAAKRRKHGRIASDGPSAEKKLTFLHVGKAGGSSAVCSIHEAAYQVHVHCEGYGYVKGQPYHFPYSGSDESAISRAVNCYVHYDYRMYCFEANDNFLINIRHPVDRILSWYIYEHPANTPVTMPTEVDGCEQLMLYSCYPTLDELATVGLADPRPAPGQSLLRVGTNLTSAECSHWAWAAVTGTVGAEYHNVLNYDWYAQHILSTKTNAQLYALRVEHLDQDWRTIDVLLGGTGNWSPAEAGDGHANSAASKDLNVKSKAVSNEGVQHLCRALCEEIQVYKAILHRAVNLKKRDIRDSLRELKVKCPFQAANDRCP
mmetsp:Transcript_14928/g.43478  ORF Transcript_14928/g.43478 Transcript_14928/m.43478 type:complete len:551 (-) Transcript_14928:97-1749(-)